MRFLRTMAGLIACILTASAAPAEGPVLQLPGSGRSLELHPESGLVACGLALKGVAFFRVAEGATAEVHPEWPTLDALALPGGGFLLADRFGKLRLVKAGADGKFAQSAEWPAEGIPTDLERRGDALFVASGGAGLMVHEWADRSAAPILRGRFPFVDYSKEVVATADGRVYLADNHDTGLQILEVKDLQRPTGLSSQQAGFVESVAVAGTVAAIASRNEGAMLFDVSNPRKPAFLLTIPRNAKAAKGSARSVCFDAKGRLLVCEGPGGARLFSLYREGTAHKSKFVADLPAAGVAVSEGVVLPDGRFLICAEDGKVYCQAVP